MKKDKIWYLKKIDLLKGLSEEQMKNVEESTKMEKVNRRKIIFFPGDPGDHVYFLKSGRIRIYRVSDGGKELTLDYLEPGDTFGELSIIDDYSHDTFAEASEDSFICVMNKSKFESMLIENPPMAFNVTKIMGLRLRKIENKIEDLVYKDVSRKLASLLINLADEYGVNDDRGILLRIKLTHKDLASLIGASRETITITLKEFKEKGLIDILSRRIIITDKEALSSYSVSSN